jgi:hypothetical protein
MENGGKAEQRGLGQSSVELEAAAQDLCLRAASAKSKEPGGSRSIGLQNTHDRDSSTANHIEKPMAPSVRKNDKITAGYFEWLSRGSNLQEAPAALDDVKVHLARAEREPPGS